MKEVMRWLKGVRASAKVYQKGPSHLSSHLSSQHTDQRLLRITFPQPPRCHRQHPAHRPAPRGPPLRARRANPFPLSPQTPSLRYAITLSILQARHPPPLPRVASPPQASILVASPSPSPQNMTSPSKTSVVGPSTLPLLQPPIPSRTRGMPLPPPRSSLRAMSSTLRLRPHTIPGMPPARRRCTWRAGYRARRSAESSCLCMRRMCRRSRIP